MKNQITNIALGLLLFLGAKQGMAQEKFYMKNGNAWSYRLLEATDDKVKYNQTNGDRSILRTWGRDNILVAFNAKGDYLMVSDLKRNADDSRKQLERFYNGSGPKTDLLIKAVPLTVIPCTIGYESDYLLNFINAKGEAGSINKKELVAVIRSNGQHEIMQDVSEAAPLLATALPQIDRIKNNLPPVEPKIEENHKPEPDKKPDVVTPNTPPPPPVPTIPTLTKIEIGEYKAKAIGRVEEFANYLKVVTDKNLPVSQRDAAIDQAVKLFLPDATVEVSSVTKSKTSKYPVREYLNRLKLLPYGKTSIEWNEIQYVSEPKQEADGNYYGIIRGVQTFTGYGTGANKDQIQYTDVTPKSVRTKFESYQKSENGIEVPKWQVLLGNIGVGNE